MSAVSTDDAVRLARGVLVSRAESAEISVWDGDDWTAGWPVPSVYGQPPGFPAGCWVAYLPSDPGIIRSSEVVVISKSTGEILCAGSAGDEG